MRHCSSLHSRIMVAATAGTGGFQAALDATNALNPTAARGGGGSYGAIEVRESAVSVWINRGWSSGVVGACADRCLGPRHTHENPAPFLYTQRHPPPNDSNRKSTTSPAS